MNTSCFEILVKGRVQGVGFRPFIYRLAKKYDLKGEVKNRGDGIYIIVEGNDKFVRLFKSEILCFAPEASDIKSLHIKKLSLNGYPDFRINSSLKGSLIDTEISPDIAVCEECLKELKTQPHRLNYPLINCTSCGPRFSIIKEMPYDRDNTTMDSFAMCDICSSEYHDMEDRRFHAQPVACNHCGPIYTCMDSMQIIYDIHQIVLKTAELVDKGKIVAVKGTGGYHLMCDALNNTAVNELRKRKLRDNKPFAVLFRNTDIVKEYCHLNNIEDRELNSWRRPVLLLQQKRNFAESVNKGLNTIGAMIPYMPFHYLLFEKLQTNAIVLTSGNLSEEPVIIDDQEAREKFRNISDAVISYNRKIHNRADDSVVRITNRKVSIIRRSRGFVPAPIYLSKNTEGILAIGADQKNCFAIGKQRKVILSQHIGDLKDHTTYSFFRESISNFSSLYYFTPEIIVCDLHPGYISSNYARSMAAESGISLKEVQHHHAHIVSCMAEQNIDEKIIGISLDGTGYGSDGNMWGGEFFIADACSFSRYAHFEYVSMPGSEMAVKEPWRMALSYVYHYYGKENEFMKLPLFQKVETEKKELVLKMLEKSINSPLTSSAGRLFDAVSALTGLCSEASYDSEGPMRLESFTKKSIKEYYPFTVSQGNVGWEDTFHSLIQDIFQNKTISIISTKFHNTIAHAIRKMAIIIREESGLNKVVLSGGVFQNKFLLEKSVFLLKKEGFQVFTNHLVSANDSGIALGQLFITSKNRKLCV